MKSFKYRFEKPSRLLLCGMSASEFKSFLKLHDYKIHRDFFKRGSVAFSKNRLYRFRYWSQDNFMVDVSCPIKDFDRWANSTEFSIKFEDWVKEVKL